MSGPSIPAAHVAVPAGLALLALVDGAFAGFRAATGRNARIRKTAYNLRAARRGIVVGLVGLGAATLVVGVALAGDSGGRYKGLVDAGVRMLSVLVPFATAVALSLAGYWLLPMRQSTFVILVGLGPFTLVRPAVVLGAAVAAVAGSDDWLVWVGTAVAATGVLVVEPWVHRRWYRDPL